MQYEKLTLARFKSRLTEGKYAGLTGARRAIGKLTDWSEKDRNKALDAALEHFEAGGASAQQSRPGGAAPASAESSRTKRPGAQNAAPAPRRAGRPLGSRNAPKAAGLPPHTSDVRVSTQAELIEVAETLRKGLEALERVAATDPNAKPILLEQAQYFAEAMRRLRDSMGVAPAHVRREVVTTTTQVVPSEEPEAGQFTERSSPSRARRVAKAR